MNEYRATLDWLYGLEARLGMDFRLERLAPVLERLGSPHKATPVIHIAGTNGKGSTAAMLHSIYTAAGYRAGLYTSPHLVSFCERIRVGELFISREKVVAGVAEIKEAMAAVSAELTFFEIATLLALLEFRRAGADVAVLEAGLGGRLDATNVCESAVSVITSVDFDHTEYLGSTIAEIAAEKAGIVKPGAPVVTGLLPEAAVRVVAAAASRCGCRWLAYGRDFHDPAPDATVALAGPHQRRNAAVAGAVVRALAGRLPVSEHDVAAGLREVRWPGRLEAFECAGGPTVLMDAAHNPSGIDSLAAALAGLGTGRPLVAVFAVMADKDYESMIARLVPLVDSFVFVPVAGARRSLDPGSLAPLVSGLRPATLASSAEAGLQLARETAGSAGTVLVTGSIFLLGQLYREVGGVPYPLVEDDLAA